MKKLLIIALTVGLGISGFASHRHPPRHHIHCHHGPHRQVPHRRPPPPRIEPVVAGIIGVGGLLLAPRYVWVEGRYETVTTVLPDGRTVTSTVWKPGYWMQVR